jgi:hypothetical protein
MSTTSKEGTMKRTITTTIAALAILAPAAHAQQPTSDAYGGVIAETVQAPAAKQQAPAQPQATESALPFTGIDALAVALGGAALLGVGGLLRRVTRNGAA